MTTLTVIQARTGSTRLPRKALAKIGRHTILEWVLHRLTLTDADLGTVVVATTAKAADNEIADLCRTVGVDCYRSSERDVLNRFYRAAVHYQVVGNHDLIVRITADCPLLCPELLAETVRLAEETRADYVGVKGAPNGFGQEAIGWPALEHSWQEATFADDREHVITYAESRPDEFKLAYVEAPVTLRNRQHWRLTVDEDADLELLDRLYIATGGDLFDLPSADVLAAVEADAGMLALATRRA